MNAVELLQAIFAILQEGLGSIFKLVARWGYPDNADGIQITVVPINRITTPFRLPSMEVPRGMSLLIKSRFTNGGLILVAENQAAATNLNQVYVLQANEWISYRVSNADSLYISGTVANDVVEITTVRARGV